MNSKPGPEYLDSTEIIDWENTGILAQSHILFQKAKNVSHFIQLAFEWVRDEIRHSGDYQLNPVTCRASEVLAAKTGFCFAKAHLLAALLRSQGVPAGFCYQRLATGEADGGFSLHGFCGVYVPGQGWYRVDPRGNKPGIDAQYTPPTEKLAYAADGPGEIDYPEIYPQPLPEVLTVLRTSKTIDEVIPQLPSAIAK